MDINPILLLKFMDRKIQHDAIHSSRNLYKNSIYIGLSRILTASTGLIFWKIATKYYSVGDVGIATALISSLGLVLTFSRLGFDSSVIRFIPLKDRDMVFNTCFWITTIASVAVSSIYILTVGKLSPSISFIQTYGVIFIIFSVLNSIMVLTGNAFLCLRKGEYYFAQNAINSLRILSLIPFAMLGSMGIFYSMGFGNIASAIISGILMLKLIHFRIEVNKDFFREVSRFSLFNYVTDIFYETPLLLLPLIILNNLGAEETAKYYIAFSIGSMILLIPDAISRSFLVEGCNGENLKTELLRALTMIYSLLLPAIIFTYLFGGSILALFGEVYAEAQDLLVLYALSSLFIAILHISNATLNIRMMVVRNAELNGLRFFLIIGLSYIMISNMGLIGAGYAWLIAHVILCGVILCLSIKEKWIK
jgi:O-antigen/teichoic acid export membrane protein